MKHYIFLLSLFFMFGTLFANPYADIPEYRAGKSLTWFFELQVQARDCPHDTETRLLELLADKEIGDEAFARVCEILKLVASSDCVDTLSKFLGDDFRCVWVCSVFRTLPSDTVDEALVNFLKTAKGKSAANAISVLADRRTDFDETSWFDFLFSPAESSGCERTAKIVCLLVNSDDPTVKAAAVKAMGKLPEQICVDTLNQIVEHGNKNEDAVDSLCRIAEKAVARGFRTLALNALKNVPQNYVPAISLRGALSCNALKYYDKFLINGNANMKYAARLSALVRTFENSGELLANMDRLCDKAKTYAIGSMTPTKDRRFFEYISKYIDSDNFDLKCAAVYAARFLCDNRAQFEKIYKLCTPYDLLGADFNMSFWSTLEYGTKEGKMSSIAAKVILESDSVQLDKLLLQKESEGDFNALVWNVLRGNAQSEKKLWNDFFGGGFDNPEIAKAVKHTITFGELKSFASRMQKDGKGVFDKAVADILVEKFKRTRHSKFTEKELDCVLRGSLDFDSDLYKDICKRLEIDKKS